MASLLPFGVTGRSDFGHGIQAFLWDALRTIANPAINRRATVVRPSGTKRSKMSRLHGRARARPYHPGSGVAKSQRASAPIAQERVRRGTKKERRDLGAGRAESASLPSLFRGAYQRINSHQKLLEKLFPMRPQIELQGPGRLILLD